MFFAPLMIVASPAFVMPPQISAQGIQAAGSATKAPAAATLNPPVWVVDASGGGDFLEIADAVAVAGEGSLVFVKPGTYHLPVVIDDRSVDVMADGMHQVVLTQPLTVQNQGQDKQVSIGGLELLEGFLIEDCLGPVQMQDCRVPATNVAVGPPPGTMYNEWILCGIGESKQTVRNSSGVSFSDCEFHGAPGIDADGSVVDGIPGQHGLLVEGSQVALYSCSLVGGFGGIGFGPGHYPSVSGSGGDGLRVKGMGSQVTHCGLVADGAPAGGGIGDVSTVTFGCDGIGVR
ncbi:MAG: hypothetical protein P1V35_10610, partial [Planctomycetota bacterium]|nr:hypothetical protein [Planctomycetota bacterium]